MRNLCCLVILCLSVSAWAAGDEILRLPIAAGAYFGVQVRDGELITWGDNTHGQLGDDTQQTRPGPVQITTGGGWVSVAAGFYHTMALKSDGSLWAAGMNTYGQLGDGNEFFWDKHRFVTVHGAGKWRQVACGTYHTVALQTDGSLWAWGANESGQLGDGGEQKRNVPVLVESPLAWTTIACGGFHTLAIQTDGSLWAWGQNEFGQLGDGGIVKQLQPERIGDDNDWVAVAAGKYHSVALKAGGQLWTWGKNEFGELGDGTTEQRLQPVMVGAARHWARINCGAFHCFAFADDGSLWAWGHNAHAQLGDGTHVNRAEPVEISSAGAMVEVAGGYYHSVGLAGDGRLLAWGRDNHGQLGGGARDDALEFHSRTPAPALAPMALIDGVTEGDGAKQPATQPAAPAVQSVQPAPQPLQPVQPVQPVQPAQEPAKDLPAAPDSTAPPAKTGAGWNQWRGPDRNGVVPAGPPLLANWSEVSPATLWEASTNVPVSLSSVSVADGRVYVAGQWHEDDLPKEGVACLDGDGNVLWRTGFMHSEGGQGSHSSPCIVDGRCYVAGDETLYCLDARTGAALWQAALSRREISSSPVVVADVVVVLGGNLMGFDAATGSRRWAANLEGNVSSPVVWLMGAQQYVLCNTFQGLACVDVHRGEILWTTAGGGNSTVAVADDLAVVVSADPAVGLIAYRLTTEAPTKLWTVAIADRGSSPLIYGDSVYLVGANRAACYDLFQGTERWHHEFPCEISSPLIADGKLLGLTESGNTLLMIEARPDRFSQLGTLAVAASFCPSPVLADGRLYLRRSESIVCLDLQRH